MAIEFIVEQGTASDDSTAYISVAELDQYFENNGLLSSVFADDNEKMTYINRCTTYIDDNYSWSGYRKTSLQALNWPRIGAEYFYSADDIRSIDNVTIPKELKKAVSLLCYYSVNSMVSLDQTSNGSIIKREMKKIDGAVTSDKEYFGPSKETFTIQEIDTILKRLISNNGKSIGVNSLIRGCE